MAETHASARQTAELTAEPSDKSLDVSFAANGDQVVACVDTDDLSLTVAVDVDDELDDLEASAFEAVRELEHLLTVRGGR
jgi:hypothetical protein